MTTLTIEEQERLAYVTGDTERAALLARIDRAIEMLSDCEPGGRNDDVINLLKGGDE